MGTILKISAGVVIGLLIFQLLMYRKTDIDYQQKQKEVMAQQALINKYIRLTNSLHSYYRRHKELPEYVADLSCTDVFDHWKEISCDSMQKNGVFYVNDNNNWAAAEPFIFDNKLYFKCKSSIKLPSAPGEYQDCDKLDIASVPEKTSPTFDCNAELDTVQKLICASDRLTAVDNKLAKLYNELLSRNDEDQRPEISDDKSRFIDHRLNACNTSDCVEKITKEKISRLELLGVYRK